MYNEQTSTTIKQLSGQTAKAKLGGLASACQTDGVVHFDFASSFIKPDQKPALEQAFCFGLTRSDKGIAPKPDKFLLVVGHADQVGTKQQNQLFSKNRGEAVWAVFTMETKTWEDHFLGKLEPWGEAEIRIMSAQVDIGGDSTLIQEYLNENDKRQGLISHYLDFLRPEWLPKRSPPLNPVTVSSPSPPILSCGADHPIRDAPGKKEQENRRVEFFYFRKPNPGISECPPRKTYGSWKKMGCTGKAITVKVELKDECGNPFSGQFDLILPCGRLNGQQTDSSGKWQRGNLPLGKYEIIVKDISTEKKLTNQDCTISTMVCRPISISGRKILKAGSPFRFFGTNAYYLLEDQADFKGEGTAPKVAKFFRLAKAHKIHVVRTWGFDDSPGKPSTTQTKDGPTIKNGKPIGGLEALGKVIDEAGRNGIYLIITFVNYWADYGGITQYVERAGKSWKDSFPPDCGPNYRVEELFYTKQEIKDSYFKYIKTVVKCFGNKPNILAWELINEPRAYAFRWENCKRVSKKSEESVKIMAKWIGYMAKKFKEEYSSQRLSIGGAEIDDLKTIFDDPDAKQYVDLVDAHLYPFYCDGKWNKINRRCDLPSKCQNETTKCDPKQKIKQQIKRSYSDSDLTMLRKAISYSDQTMKPFYLGEFGIGGYSDPEFTKANPDRVEKYKKWSEELDKSGASGLLFWQLLTPDRSISDEHEIVLESPGKAYKSQATDAQKIAEFAKEQAEKKWKTC